MDFEVLLRDKYHIDLNPQQKQAVLCDDGPVLLLAVPGSGKTTAIVARCAYLTLCRGVPAERILTLTFNRAAQRDMESRFRSVFGADAQGTLRFSTIHSFCNSVLREYGALVGRKVPRLVEESKPRLLRQLYARMNDGEYLPDDRLEELSNRIGFVKNSMLTDEQIAQEQYDIKNFSAIFSAYEQYKNENGFMDFDDMLDKALAVFKVKPEILERVRARYHYVNVDEAQDTSRLQHAIIRLIAAPRNNLFMVGDEDQSIYLFRAADPAYLLEFQQVYPDARVLLMERNYRSTGAIVETAGRLIGKNAARHKKAMATENDRGGPVAETMLADSSLLCDYIVSRLREAFTGTTAVLYRENTSVVALMDALERAGIPFAVREHRLNFFDHWVVRDIQAYLALARDPGDMAALRQIYYKLNAFISRDMFEQAAELHRQGMPSAVEAVLACPGLRESGAERLKKFQQDLAGLPGLAPGPAVEYIMERLGYGQYLKKTGGEGYYTESLLHIAESLLSVARRTESHGELLERMAALAELASRAGSGGCGAVTLSTVHSAKGLEFDRVLITDLIDGRFPTAAAIADAEQAALARDPAQKARHMALMEEERRLFYVAVTRARRQVELISVGHIYGAKVKLSRFIREALPWSPLRRAVASRLDNRAPEAPQPAPRPGAWCESARKAAAVAHVNLEEGTEVWHKSFGQGVVVGYDAGSDVVAVRFPKYGVKTLAAAYCMGEGMMKKRRDAVEPD